LKKNGTPNSPPFQQKKRQAGFLDKNRPKTEKASPSKEKLLIGLFLNHMIHLSITTQHFFQHNLSTVTELVEVCGLDETLKLSLKALIINYLQS
jgi:hypothetical protein